MLVPDHVVINVNFGFYLVELRLFQNYVLCFVHVVSFNHYFCLFLFFLPFVVNKDFHYGSGRTLLLY